MAVRVKRAVAEADRRDAAEADRKKDDDRDRERRTAAIAERRKNNLKHGSIGARDPARYVTEEKKEGGSREMTYGEMIAAR